MASYRISNRGVNSGWTFTQAIGVLLMLGLLWGCVYDFTQTILPGMFSGSIAASPTTYFILNSGYLFIMIVLFLKVLIASSISTSDRRRSNISSTVQMSAVYFSCVVGLLTIWLAFRDMLGVQIPALMGSFILAADVTAAMAILDNVFLLLYFSSTLITLTYN